MLKLASWNVNSLRVRIDQVLQWFISSDTDILALQETKLSDAQFPLQCFRDLGLYVVFSGEKTYNGVAVISKFPFSSEALTDIDGMPDSQRRILAVSVNGLRIINIYVPNGAAFDTDKYQYKLEWLEGIRLFIKQQLSLYSLVAVVGDFNIAPQDIDVGDVALGYDCVLTSLSVRLAFNKLLSLGLHDSFRNIEQESALFSWWDYRAGAFYRNKGLRIDLILLSDTLNAICIDSGIDIAPRRANRPSDHAPVWVKLNYIVD